MKLWPTGIASRVALILMICLFVVQAVSVILYVHDRALTTTRVFARSAAQRVAAIVELMATTPLDQRQALINAVTSPTLWVRWSPEAPPPTESWHNERLVVRMIRRHLQPDFRNRPIRVVRLRRWSGLSPHREIAGFGQPPPDLLPSRQKIAVIVGQRDGSWLTFVVSTDNTSLAWAGRMGFWIILTGAFVLVFAIWAARRVTKPLRRFSEAAERLGVDMHAPPLPETGSGELRRATEAFNRMQQRLRRFIDDRTLMLAAISHDLRTALTRLRLRAEFIEDPEQQRKAVADLDEMQAMLDETLSFARNDAATEPRVKVDLPSLLQSLCDDITDTGQKAAYQGPDRLSCLCRPMGLRRAFSNVIGNAATYGIEALVTLSQRNGTILVAVADHGPGIAEELREKVFTPFFRIEGSRSRTTGGTGLGLSVARSIVRGHGGDITLHDREGGGLEVRVALPREQD